MTPSIDIVTVCKDAAELLEPTILSVRSAGLLGRYIIVDGASTDGTRAMVARHGAIVSEFISEPDGGISDAMNKALANSTGDYVLFLHAGDILLNNGAMASVVEALSRDPVDIISCPVLLGGGAADTIDGPRGLNGWMRLKTGIPHQGAICSRRLFDRIGAFDVNLKVAMDYDFFLRAYLARATIRYQALPLAKMEPGGLSWQMDWPALKARLDEEKLIHARYASSAIQRALYAGYWAIYPTYKRIRAWQRTRA
jgi:glycosyltransferase involved in cell wall biosynthesis